MTQSNPQFTTGGMNNSQQHMYNSYNNMMGMNNLYYSNPGAFIGSRPRSNATLHPGFGRTGLQLKNSKTSLKKNKLLVEVETK